MKPQTTLSRVTTPEGKELVLYERDGVFSIRVGGLELMSSRAHGSEEALARLVLSEVREKRAEVLVGGLGMGFTLRAVLNFRPPVFTVTVAELFPAVVAWNRGELAHLAHSPLQDPRVKLFEGDVADLVTDSPNAFDAILLDVDNGPAAFTLARNERLYGPDGIVSIKRSLKPGGVLGVWSADPDPSFARTLGRAGFRVRTEQVPARGIARGPKHTIFVATSG